MYDFLQHPCDFIFPLGVVWVTLTSQGLTDVRMSPFSWLTEVHLMKEVLLPNLTNPADNSRELPFTTDTFNLHKCDITFLCCWATVTFVYNTWPCIRHPSSWQAWWHTPTGDTPTASTYRGYMWPGPFTGGGWCTTKTKQSATRLYQSFFIYARVWYNNSAFTCANCHVEEHS